MTKPIRYPGYRVGYATNTVQGVELMVCITCGAVVGSIPAHNAWHLAIATDLETSGE